MLDKTTPSFSSFLFANQHVNQETKMTLHKLGFRRLPKRTLTELFGLHPNYWTRIPILGGDEGGLFVLKFVFDGRHMA
jgi:hypothetical protein